MQRRKFIRNTMGLGFTPVFVNNTFAKAYDNLLGLQHFTCGDVQGRSLVFIDLFGGNDGINTVIPVQQSKYDTYAALRTTTVNSVQTTIAIPRAGSTNGAINLDSTLPEERQISLHPAMTAFKALFDQGKLNVMNGVGYPNNNRSHFKANDHWLSAGDSTTNLNNLESGWVGRYLQSVYPGNFDGPTTAFPDPLGMEFGSSSSSLLFKADTGKFANLLLTLGAGDYYNLVSGLGTPNPVGYPNSQFRDEINYINTVENASDAFSLRINNVFNAGSNSVTYPSTSLANQLKTVARLIKGGSKTKVFLVHHSGFDTHVTQNVDGATHTGNHANILKTLADAVKAFQDDLAALGIEDKVVTTTYSEFGRTVDINGSRGTDHGGVNPMFVIGKGVQGGVSGNPIDLTRVSNRGCIDLQFDYRTVYASILQDFIGVDSAVLTNAKLNSFTKAPVLQTTYLSSPACYSGMTVLPIVLLDLSARAVGSESIVVNWSTAQEINTNKFHLERSNDAVRFTRIATLPAAGNSTTDRAYDYTDYDAKDGINYYRLIQTDIDERSTTFGPVHAVLRKSKSVNVKSYPNPSVSDFKIEVTAVERERASVIFYDMEGHTLQSKSIQLEPGTNTFNYNNSMFGTTHKQLIICVQYQSGKRATVKHVLR